LTPRASAMRANSWVKRCASRFVGNGEDAAGELRAARRERRLDGYAFGDGLHVAVAAELAHQLGRRDALRELLRIGIEGEDAALQLVVFDPRLRAQLLQAIARVERQVQALDGVVPRPRRQAFVEELQSPAPLLRIGAQPEQERRVVAAQPLQDLERCVRIGPRFRIGCRDLAAVRERGFERRARMTVEHRDLVPVLREIPGGGDAHDARAEDEDAHQAAAASAASPA